MTLVCLDTQIVIWRFQSTLNQHWQHEHQIRIVKSTALVKLLESKDCKVMLPTPVVAEVLVKFLMTNMTSLSAGLRETSLSLTSTCEQPESSRKFDSGVCPLRHVRRSGKDILMRHGVSRTLTQ